jgi:hypothetical protein
VDRLSAIKDTVKGIARDATSFLSWLKRDTSAWPAVSLTQRWKRKLQALHKRSCLLRVSVLIEGGDDRSSRVNLVLPKD